MDPKAYPFRMRPDNDIWSKHVWNHLCKTQFQRRTGVGQNMKNKRKFTSGNVTQLTAANHARIRLKFIHTADLIFTRLQLGEILDHDVEK